MSEIDLVADFVRTSLRLAEGKSALLAGIGGRALPARDLFEGLATYADDFIGGSENRMIVMPGLRGTGKSTLMAQLYAHIRGRGIPATRILYISLDDLRLQTGKGLNDAIQAYQGLLGMAFLELRPDEPVFLLLDEVHNDPGWGIALKVLYDNSKRVFALATGSSTLQINMTADLARRARTEHLDPVTFSEWMSLGGKAGSQERRSAIADALFRSKNAADAYEKLRMIRSELNEVVASIWPMGLERFLRVGQLPNSLRERDENVLFQSALEIERKVVSGDLGSVKGFDAETLVKASNLLTHLAFSDRMSYESIINAVGTNKHTLNSMLNALEAAELLLPVRPYASVGARFRKTPKYKFAAPVFRAAHMWALGRPLDSTESLGLLFEDAAAMYLHKMTHMPPIIDVAFDPNEGGADFIVTSGTNRSVAMEVSFGRKGTEQVIASAARYPVAYGVLVSKSDLELVEEDNVVKVPREWFLLSA
jgi:predicted AAA+ superfamily ATPase